MANANEALLSPGTVVNGRYEVLCCLGEGSMGTVYACLHQDLRGFVVAMKVLFPKVASDSTLTERFRQEILAAYTVNHFHVVRAYEYFQEDDLVAYTMEYVNGGDLAGLLRTAVRSGRLFHYAQIVRFLYQICLGVQAIHCGGFVHRDLKPENILLTKEGEVKIADLGMACSSAGPKLSERGQILGTVHYISPEYIEKGKVDARSDIYSLGVVAYEMITGVLPFRGKSVIETITMRLHTTPKTPKELRNDCPLQLNNIVLRALEKNCEKRYQEIQEMINDLHLISQTELIEKDSLNVAPESPSISERLIELPEFSRI